MPSSAPDDMPDILSTLPPEGQGGSSAPPPGDGGGAEGSNGTWEWDPAADALTVRRDMELRWGQGERPRVHDYLPRHPALAASPEWLLDLIAFEWALLRGAGEVISLGEYLERFSQYRDDLCRLFASFRASCPTLPPDQAPTPSVPWPPLTPSFPAPVPPQGSVLTRTGPGPEEGSGRVESGVDPVPSTLAVVEGEGPGGKLPTVPGFEVLRELGQGGMGEVYLARQRSLNRLIALKMIRGGSTRRDLLERFQAEAKAVARLQHPNIVQIHEVEEYRGRPYFCLEYVEGGSLDRKLKGKPQQPREAAQLVEVLAGAMQAAHERDIIHRDLKPGNILLTAAGVPKVTDFGLAKQLDEESWRTHSGALVGTPSYMAPEQADGKKDIGPAVDVYALGAILYELLTGRPPFRAATLMDTLDQVRHQEPVPPRRLQPKVPKDLETICLKCLQKEPNKRYASARALAEDLRRFLDREPVLARPTPAWERAMKWVRRRPALAALLATLLVAACGLVGGALIYLDQRHHEAERLAKQVAEDEQQAEAIKSLLGAGQDALHKRDWAAAEAKFHEADAKIRQGAALLEPFHKEVHAGLRDVESGKQAAEKFDRFQGHLRDARFAATLNTGKGLLVNLQKAREAVRSALALWGVSVEGKQGLALDVPLAPKEKRLIQQGCYELVLILAEVEALTPGSGPSNQLENALALLDRADALGYGDVPSRDRPTHASLLRRARYLRMLKHDTDAEEQRKRAKNHPPATALDYYVVGDELFKQGDMAEAVRAFEAAIRIDPNHFWAHYFAAMTYLRLQRPSEAKTHLSVCIKEQSEFYWIYILRAYACTQLGEYADAEADYQKALGQDLDNDARHVLFANRGLMRFQQERFDKAVEDLKTAINLKPKEYQARVTLAQVYQSREEWPKAVDELTAAIAAAPDLAFLYHLRARVQRLHSPPRLAEALRDVGEAIRIEGRSPTPATLARYWTEKGLLHGLRSEFLEAGNAYEKASALDPNYPEPYLGWAQARIKLGQYEAALKPLDSYLKKGGPRKAEAYQARGQVFAKRGHYPEAIEDYTRALGHKPSNPEEILAVRGWAHLATGSYALALPDFQKVVGHNARDAEALGGLGYAEVKRGKYVEAVNHADDAVRLIRTARVPDPVVARVYHFSARVYAQAVARMEADPGAGKKNRSVRELWKARALTALSQAVEALPRQEQARFWRSHVSRDPDFDPVRDRPGFIRLDHRYAAPRR